jgi:surface polysaccharide O-acyltransferase-like enzyme
LLFMVSGVATACMFEKMRLKAFLGRRSVRLLVPLIFGMFVVVPPQSYLQVVEKFAYAGSYGDFMRLYIGHYHGFCSGTECLRLPTWNHLWFVAYLWCYTLAYAVLACLPGRPLARLAALLERSFTGWRVIVLPTALLALARILLYSRFPATHDVVNDWYNHADYFTLFLIGALMARSGGFWRQLEALRFTGLALALTTWAVVMVYIALPEHTLPGSPEAWRDAQRVVYALCQWSAIVAICGFGHRHLQCDSVKRRYLTQAVFPLYIAHQTVIVVFAHALKAAQMPPELEGIVLVVLTFTASFGIFEVVRRVPVLRACFGIAHITAAAAAVATAPSLQPSPRMTPLQHPA